MTLPAQAHPMRRISTIFDLRPRVFRVLFDWKRS
jgi:hypothetical protein